MSNFYLVKSNPKIQSLKIEGESTKLFVAGAITD
jgi:hypothetical protein